MLFFCPNSLINIKPSRVKLSKYTYINFAQCIHGQHSAALDFNHQPSGQICVIQQQQISLSATNFYKLALPNASSSPGCLEIQLTRLLLSSGCKQVSGTAEEVSLLMLR